MYFTQGRGGSEFGADLQTFHWPQCHCLTPCHYLTPSARVCTLGRQGEPQSANASFFTALFDQHDDWNGSAWITSAHNQYTGSFNLPANFDVRRATAYWAALGYGVLFVNGARVAPDEALGPWTTWSRRVLYRCHDVSSYVRPGLNRVGVWVGHGQYSSKWTHVWAKAKPPLGLLFHLRVHNSSGATARFGSGPHWTAEPGPVVTDDVYAGETFDARLLRPTWNLPGEIAGGGEPASLWEINRTLGAMPVLSAHMYTPIRRTAERWPVKLTEPSPGVYLFHFAENFVGTTAVHNVSGPAGATLKLSHSEQLALPNGTYCLVDCGGDVPGLVAKYPFGGAQDVLILAGRPGGESWDGALFSYHGYQFVQLEGWPDGQPKPTLASLSGHVIHSDNRPAANVTFPSTSLLGRINDNIVRSLLSNMHSVESDCPTRERVGWTGDAQGTAEVAVLQLHMASFYTKWLQDMQDAQLPGGGLSSTVPYAKHYPPVDPSWPTAYPQIARLLYRYYGDLRVVQTHYDSIKAYVDYVGSVKSCPSCRNPHETQTDGLVDFYMNGETCLDPGSRITAATPFPTREVDDTLRYCSPPLRLFPPRRLCAEPANVTFRAQGTGWSTETRRRSFACPVHPWRRTTTFLTWRLWLNWLESLGRRWTPWPTRTRPRRSVNCTTKSTCAAARLYQIPAATRTRPDIIRRVVAVYPSPCPAQAAPSPTSPLHRLVPRPATAALAFAWAAVTQAAAGAW